MAVLQSLICFRRTANEDIVQSSARFSLEYRLMEQRVRMDVPTLTDSNIRDLFHESDLFVRSFSGAANFGLFSPLDLLRILTLLSETLSHIFVLWTLTTNPTHLSLLAFSIISFIIPLLISWCRQNPEYTDNGQDIRAARASAKQNKMRAMAQSDAYRYEVVLFGLGPWILDNWAKARKATLGLDQSRSFSSNNLFSTITSNVDVAGLLMAFQNVCFTHVCLAALAHQTCLDTRPFGNAIFVYLPGVVHFVPKLYRIHRLQHPTAVPAFTDGVPECLSHGRILGGDASPTSVTASRRRQTCVPE